MADWYGTSRSNYFRVKDVEAFKAWTKRVDARFIEQGERVGFVSDNEFGALPSTIYNEATEEWEDIDLAGDLAEHLQEGEVAIMVEAGAEKARYVTGYALAVNSEGATASLSIDDIVGLAKGLTDRPQDVTAPSY